MNQITRNHEKITLGATTRTAEENTTRDQI